MEGCAGEPRAGGRGGWVCWGEAAGSCGGRRLWVGEVGKLDGPGPPQLPLPSKRPLPEAKGALPPAALTAAASAGGAGGAGRGELPEGGVLEGGGPAAHWKKLQVLHV